MIAVTDRLVILHRGQRAAEVLTKDSNEHEIVSLIMGKTKARRVVSVGCQAITPFQHVPEITMVELPVPTYARNMRLIGYSDQGGRPDGNQLMVHRGYAYVGHMCLARLQRSRRARPQKSENGLVHSRADAHLEHSLAGA